jgi:hypothetical protein
MGYRGEGVYYPEAVASLYTFGSIPKLGGMVAKLEADIPTEIGPRDSALVIDLMQAPSALLRGIVEAGHFNGKSAADMGHPTLSEMLLAPQPAELVLGVWEKDNENSEEKNIRIIGEVGVGNVCHVIGKKQTVSGNSVVSGVRIETEQRGESTRRRWAGKKAGRKMQPIEPRTGPQLEDDEMLIASFGLNGGGLQLRTGHMDDSAVVKTMRNAGPLSTIDYA